MLYPLSYGRVAWWPETRVPSRARSPKLTVLATLGGPTTTHLTGSPAADADRTQAEGPDSTWESGPCDAETVGFEPTEGLPLHDLSRVAH